MRGVARHALLAVVALAIGGLLFRLRAATVPEARSTRSAGVGPVGVQGEPGPAPAPARSLPEAGTVDTVFARALRGDFPVDLPAEVLSGPLTVQGPGEDARALEEPALTESQRTIVQALRAERDARLAELRGEIAARPPDAAGAERLLARAAGTQAVFLAALRGALLPDQRARFESLLSSGRWGGYTLAIPLRR